jgi:hypothetical protein
MKTQNTNASQTAENSLGLAYNAGETAAQTDPDPLDATAVDGGAAAAAAWTSAPPLWDPAGTLYG